MTTEQLLTAATNITKNTAKNSAETLTALSMARLDALQKLVDLNLQTMRKALEQMASVSRDMLTSDHPQDGFAPSLQAFQASSQKLMSDYFSQTAKIAADSQQELVEAMQRQVDKAQQQFKPMLELNAPSLSGNGMQPLSTWFDQMLSNANQFYGTLQQLSKTAAETTQNSLRSLDGAAAQAAGSRPAGGRRAAAA